MKYALVGGQRKEPQAGLRGVCQACGLPMVAKCGQQRIHHWAHRTAECDKWWERETAWHREWKNTFPEDWQEVRMQALSGDVHIADIRTPDGTVLEFQHSHLPESERLSREGFYGRMAWVVDGLRKPNDLSVFVSFLAADIPDYGKMLGWRFQLRRFVLVDTWASARCPVYLDFGETNVFGKGLPPTGLLWRITKSASGRVIATPLQKQNVIDHYMLGTPLVGFEPHRRSTHGYIDYRALD